MSILLRKLEALQYPALEALRADDSLLQAPSLQHPSLRTLVAWLEASKIRLLPVGDRAALQDVQNDARWTAALDAYLRALKCSRPFSSSMSPEQTSVVLDWLAGQAVAAEYADHAGEFNALSRMWFIRGEDATAAAGASAAQGALTGSGAQQQPLVCSGEAFEAEVRELAALFKLSSGAGQQAALLRVVRKRVEECLIAETAAQQSAAAASAANAGAAAPSTGSAVSGKSKRPARRSHAPPVAAVPMSAAEVDAALSALETGFPSTGDALVERAARVLRLLFLHDLRQSQNLANELMALAQNYTSDPRTESKLGKVGR